jgi:periplasmic glucans biosynthesis protein
MRRRTFVYSSLAACVTAWVAASTSAQARPAGMRLGEPTAFSFESLIERARSLARAPYREPPRPAPDLVAQIGYDAHGRLQWKRDRALFADGPATTYPVTFFHLGQLFPKAVKMHELRAGRARELLYDQDGFEMPADSVGRKLPSGTAGVGFAGFRLHETKRRADWKTQDWVAFLGASYFRAIGSLNNYGASARGVAVNTSAGTAEEFPDFIEFYLEAAASERDPVVVYALLDGPSVTGAYRITCRRSAGVVTEVENVLFLRKDVAQLGIAPLTSMHWYGENERRYRADWRPEVHDSDGLALWNGTGEYIFRPLYNPSSVTTSSFVDNRPKGFGLVQRDRNFENYLDGVNYDKRPSVWVEMLSDFGEGAVKLVEIPTDDETMDNVVAFWCSKAPTVAGAELRYKYRLHWQSSEPFLPKAVAHVAATRLGRGGEPGTQRPKQGKTKFVVELAGAPLDKWPLQDKIEAAISTSHGEISKVMVEPVGSTKRWRVQFDLAYTDDKLIELRMYLHKGPRTLSETWAYQYNPRGAG